MEKLAATVGAEREDLVLSAVLESVAAILRHGGVATIDPDRGFLDLGIDSLTAVELRNRLGGVIGVRLPATAIFDHPSPAALTSYLSTLVPNAARSVAAEGPVATTTGTDGDPDLALARLEATLTPDSKWWPESDTAHRGEVAARLRVLLSRLDARGSSTPAAEATAAFADLTSASDEEIFSFIDGDPSGSQPS
ncbi:phosphopantetheine-binding protein [Catenulispora rubra]|uniref:phosphopantetheine-binding protein n=1 Tax=Catenulispora rubra TaxID=280293 RepID=UPI00189204D0|nr:acyl carrier protein [Catenulispora rubra]